MIDRGSRYGIAASTTTPRPARVTLWPAFAVAVVALSTAPTADAVIWPCLIPNCPTSCGEASPGGGTIQERLSLINRSLYSQPQARFRPQASEGSLMQRRYLAKGPVAPFGSGGQTLYGDFPGQWDEVSGYVTFPHSFDGGITTDQILLRGLRATATGTGDTYEVGGWTRSAYWITGDDSVPRVLPATMIVPSYVPQPGEPFTDSGSLNIAPLMLYKEDGRDYSAYPEDGAFATIFFVADPVTGEILDAIVDLYDANSVYEKTEYLYENDSMQPLLLMYRLAEPDFTFYAEYGEHILLGESVSIDLANHVPGVDFVDPFLSAIGFDAANTPLELLLEGARELSGGEVEFGYSAVYPLGYTWSEAADKLFDSGFESPAAAAPKSRIVRTRLK